MVKIIFATAISALVTLVTARAALQPNTSPYVGQQVAEVFGVVGANDVARVADNVVEVLRERFGPESVTARATPSQLSTLESIGFRVNVVIPDLAAHLSENSPVEIKARRARASTRDSNGTIELDPNAHFTKFYTYSEMNAYLDEIVKLPPKNGKANWIVKKSIGKTLENRDIWAMELGNPDAKYVVYLEGGLHAREWVAPSSVQYILANWAMELNNGKNQDIFDKIRFAFVPLVNVDGYHYTFTTERLWRKNRRSTPDKDCFGVDLNRNFNGFKSWKKGDAYCSSLYSGTKPFSEPETQAIVQYLKDHKTRSTVVAAFDIHSHDQSILYPYGYDFNLPDAPNKDAHVKCGNLMASAIKASSGKVYKVKSSADLYPGDGCADDYFYDQVVRGPWANNTGLVYTIEMRPDTNDPIGFILPASQALPAAKELYAAFQAAVNFISSNVV